MKLDLPVMAAALAAAAAIQEFLPAIPAGSPHCKLQILPCVAFYYIYSRQWQQALCAAMWAGVLMDAMGPAPSRLAAPAMLCYALVAVALRESPTAVAPGLAATFLRALPFMTFTWAMRLVPAMSGARLGGLPASWAWTVPASAAVAVAVSRLLRRADLLARNMEFTAAGVAE